MPKSALKLQLPMWWPTEVRTAMLHVGRKARQSDTATWQPVRIKGELGERDALRLISVQPFPNADAGLHESRGSVEQERARGRAVLNPRWRTPPIGRCRVGGQAHTRRNRDRSSSITSTTTTERPTVGSKMLVAVMVATSQRGAAGIDAAGQAEPAGRATLPPHPDAGHRRRHEDDAGHQPQDLGRHSPDRADVQRIVPRPQPVHRSSADCCSGPPGSRPRRGR